MQRDRSPHLLDVVLVHAVLRHEIARGIRAVHFEAIALAAIGRHQAHVVEHRTEVQQFRVVLQAFAVAAQRAEQEDAARMVVQEIGFGIANQFGRGACNGAVGYFDACDDGVSHVGSFADG